MCVHVYGVWCVGVHAGVSAHVLCMCVYILGQVQYKMNAIEPGRQRSLSSLPILQQLLV